MKTQLKLSTFVALLFLVVKLQSQISGSFTVPVDFPDMAAAINTLNVMGVAGPVTICVNAGYTETVAAGGLKLFNVPGSSSTNTVVFQKNGAGANPLLVSYSGGTGTPTTAVQDGVWWLIGADYITIDGIDIFDGNTANPSTMEFGYGLYNASTSDGCQYNTIKNCVVTLNRINSALGTGLNAGGSRGIESICASYTANVTTYTPSSSSGTHSYNKYYSNIVQNCHNGICVMGYQSGSPYTLSDQQNDIGGISAVTGNTVINFGDGTGTVVTSGIRTKSQYSLSVGYNILKNNTGSGADPNGELNAIYLGPAIAASVSVRSNTISLTVNTPTYEIYGIQSTNASYSLNISILNNVFSACSFTSAGTRYLIYEQSQFSTSNISNNLFKNITGSNYPRSTRLIETSYASTRTISSNTLTNFTATGSFYGINVSSDVNLTISNNVMDSVTAYGADGIFHSPSTSTLVTNVSIVSNIFRNVVTNDSYGIFTAAFGSTRSVAGNTICNISTVPGATTGLQFTGIYVRGGTSTLTANSIYSISSIGSNPFASPTQSIYALTGIFNYAGSPKISNNKIGSFSSNGLGAIHGVSLELTSTYTINNNIIGDFNITNSKRSDGIVGINIEGNGGSNTLCYYNTVYLNSSSTSTANFGSCALMLPLTSQLTVRNNIFINTSVSTGTGVAVAIRNLTTSLTQYSTASNNNILYAGTSSGNRGLYFDGTNTYTSLVSFKTALSPREVDSYSENSPFITTDAGSANFLSLNPSIPTLAEGTAVPITGFTTDYAGTTRNSSTPDVGAWEGNFLQADISTPTIITSGFTTPACDLTGRTLTVNITDASGVASGSLSPRIFYRRNFGLYSSSQGTLASGTYSNGTWVFNMSFSGVAGDIIRYFFTAQDLSPLTNLALIPSTGGSVTSVNTVPTPPTSTFTYAIESAPSVSVNSGNICSGSSFTIVPSGALSYTITGGLFTVTPSVTTSYSVTGTSTAGCVSSNTAVVTITVTASPTLSINSGSICSGQSFTFTASGADTYTYSGGSSVVNPMSTALYTVTGTNTLAGCVSAPAIATVTVYTTPTISVNSGSICEGSTFTIAPSGAAVYTISGGMSTVSPPTSSVYIITGASSEGCFAINTATANLAVAPLPSISVNSGSICSGKSFTLVPSGASTYSYSGSSATVSPSATTVYSVTGTSSLGCLSSNIALSTVSVAASPTITVNSGSICSGQTFSILPSDVLLTYTYSGGSAYVSPSSTSSYSVSGTNSLGCTSNLAVSSVSVSQSPTVSVNSGTVCYGNSFTLVPSGATSYTIAGGSTVVSPLSGAIYTIVGQSLAGCLSVNTASANLFVAPLPTVSINSGTICSGSNFTLVGSGAQTYSYPNGSAIVSPTSNTVYPVSGTSSLGCQSATSAIAGVTVLALPITSVNSGSICSGQTFTLIPSNSALTYTYSGGSSVVSPLANTVYSVSGSDSFGCSSPVAISSVTVASSPTVSVNSGTICSGSVFTLSLSGAASYSIAGNSQYVSPLTTSLYTVSGVSAEGCVSVNTATATVNVSALPTVTITNGYICAGSVYTFNPAGASTYSYSSGSNTVSPSTTTSYSIIGVSAFGCQSSSAAVVSVSVFSLPVLAVSGLSATCSGVTQSLSVTGANTYTWMGSSTGSVFIVTPSQSTNYMVTGTDLNGCSANGLINVQISAGPVITVSGSSVICAGGSVNLNASGTALTYTWSNGTLGNIASFSPTASTVFSVTGTGINTCLNTATFVVYVNSNPLVSTHADHVSVCAGSPLTLSGSGAMTYTWSGGISDATPFYPSVSNTYTVTGTDVNGCRNSASVQINVYALPVITISVSNSGTVCIGDELILTAGGGNIYSWNSGEITPTVSIHPIAATSYTVIGTDVNGCKASAVYFQDVEACVGLSELKSEFTLHIYPNPSTGFFQLDITKLSDNLRLELVNLQGELIFQRPIISQFSFINLNEQSKGIYLLRIYKGHHLVKTEKLIVTN